MYIKQDFRLGRLLTDVQCRPYKISITNIIYMCMRGNESKMMLKLYSTFLRLAVLLLVFVL